MDLPLYIAVDCWVVSMKRCTFGIGGLASREQGCPITCILQSVALARRVEPDSHISLYRLHFKRSRAVKSPEAFLHETKHDKMSKKYKIASNRYETKKEIAPVEQS